MDEYEKHAAAIRKEHGEDGLKFIARNKQAAGMQSDVPMADYWEAVSKAFRRLDK
ncbi:hypothetical protein GS397_15710 [Sphingobium yanoikuyae]|uniref:Uncharacterized protein n=1 Tax=Sphingobium yanoikuyae TaxID=13690 RepID=A0A6P1GLH9_SPHYA|nr:hypothetical protein [Sphingobium yanoikuyae]QHD68351.1 hypothetical protein GS397_15710 [Sphingobium yanoikuyae]